MRSIALADAWSSGRNNFNLIRLFAAWLVIYGHAWAITGSAGGDLVTHLTRFKFAGGVAVDVFFFISGYLIAQSWERSSDGVDFAAKRLGRIYPGLVVATLFSIVLVGAAMTTWSQADYWSSPVTWTNLLNNSAVLTQAQRQLLYRNYGIQLLFAAAIFCIALVVSKRARQTA